MHLLQYLFKLSISLAVLFIFYRAVLRPLTFYRCNRFYLLGYSLLCFVIPFINVSPWIAKEGGPASPLVNIIPSIGGNTIIAADVPVVWSSLLQRLSFSQWLMLLFCLGAVVMLTRTLYQYLSLRRIRSTAVLLRGRGAVRLYQTAAPVSPFSFGNAIYFNRSLHTEEELQRIIQHEFVHVKQKHSVDILLGELLCIVNWFNPFAWFIRHAIRQNLEFIADNEVVANGINKKEYQYLLLRVVGIPQYSIANNFNFSSLKKRIAMMNKMKSAKLHVVKFVFILPLLVVLLLAFRNKINKGSRPETFVFTGIVYDAATAQPLEGVLVNDSCSGLSARTDAHGFFKMNIPVAGNAAFNIGYRLELAGLNSTHRRQLETAPGNLHQYANLLFAGLYTKQNAAGEIPFDAYHQLPVDDKHQFVPNPDYYFVQERFNAFQHERGAADRFAILTKDSKKPIWLIDGAVYAISKNGWTRMDHVGADGCKVIVDGKWMSIEEANALVNRFELDGVTVSSGQNSVKRYGVNANVISLNYTTRTGNATQSDTLPDLPVPVKPEPKAVPAAPIDLQPAPAAPVEARLVPVSRPAPPVPVKSGWEAKSAARADLQPAPTGPVKAQQLPAPVAAPVPAIAPLPGLPAIDRVAAPMPLVVVDGEIKPAGYDVQKIAPGDIKKIDVLADETATGKYGTRGKYGVVEITTIPPLFIVDGVEQAAGFGIKNIPPQNMESVVVSKDNNITDKYGDKGKHGVVEIYMKKPVSIPAGVLIILDGRTLPPGAKVENYIRSADIKSAYILKDKASTDKFGESAKNGIIILQSKRWHSVPGITTTGQYSGNGYAPADTAR